MKTLHYSIIAVLIFALYMPTAYADSSTQIDGTVSLKGCNIINGNITQATDIQNTTIQMCNYHGKHFKLVDSDACILIGFGKVTDPQTGHAFNFPVVCDIPATCDPKEAWIYYTIGHPEKLPVVVNGASSIITINYGRGMCGSESYDAQEKKLSITANDLWVNQTKMYVLIPKDLVGNITAVTVNGKSTIPYVTDYPSSNAIPACPACYNVEIPLTFSTTPLKIELGAKSIPEFPFAIPILLISMISLIVFYRIKKK